MFGYGQRLQYPEFFYVFAKFFSFKFIVFIAGNPAIKIMGQHMAASG
jgi:hypothetical protein